ncbi:MAG TPA: four-carbon acid sugar kinase family protein, partial [Alphaproteobacteria bacterium]|nr:four-carbon acid sugar kinase family protein [Alphaproteobacteria bacterium]
MHGTGEIGRAAISRRIALAPRARRKADILQIPFDLFVHQSRQYRARRGCASGRHGRGLHSSLPGFSHRRAYPLPGPSFCRQLLLSESFMRTHPMTPMKQSNLIRVLSRQTKHQVDLVPHEVVTVGPEAIRNHLKLPRDAGNRFAIVDAVSDRNLVDTGIACRDMKLVTGSSGAALALPKNFRRAGLLGPDSGADILPSSKGYSAVVAVSCSQATLAQVAYMKNHHPAFFVDGMKLGGKRDVAKEALEWAKPKLADGPVLIYSSAEADVVKKVQRKHGVE